MATFLVRGRGRGRGWIATKERQPNYLQEVLGFGPLCGAGDRSNGGRVSVCLYAGDGEELVPAAGWPEGRAEWSFEVYGGYGPVTHWMPLPVPPDGGGGADDGEEDYDYEDTRRCVRCGCTPSEMVKRNMPECVGENRGCSWSGPDLCSWCLEDPNWDGHLVDVIAWIRDQTDGQSCSVCRKVYEVAKAELKDIGDRATGGGGETDREAPARQGFATAATLLENLAAAVCAAAHSKMAVELAEGPDDMDWLHRWDATCGRCRRWPVCWRRPIFGGRDG